MDLTVPDDPDTRSMAEMQLQGIAALYNILCEHRFAYLADEVGMGKTYQALGLAALVWNEDPDARVLFVSPRQNLQLKWFGDYRRFFASNYRRKQGLGDDRAATVLFSQPVHRPVLFHNLRSWTPYIGMSVRLAPFVRHTSFMRPVYITSEDLHDTDVLWNTTNRKLRSWGLFDAKRPDVLTASNASEVLNLTFAASLNSKLTEVARDEPYFDLVIVDEAQCLRNPENQTNRVLFAALKHHVRKWLFMSATPAHGGPADLPRILNHYPDKNEVLDPNLNQDLPALQEALKPYLVRRQRRYRTGSTQAAELKTVGKNEYRHHDDRIWGVRDEQMSVLGTLAMGLVQKGLVQVLRGRNNRYRVGFLSSFESLQTSLSHTSPPFTPASDANDERSQKEWHRDATDTVTESEAPDTEFIDRLASSFEERFRKPLPHPKIDSVVDRVAPLAFGTDKERGGHKFLIFTRRVSTVGALCDRFTREYHRAIEARMRRCWDVALDWTGEKVRVADDTDTDDPEGFDAELGESPIRNAMSKGKWLFHYRQTFRGSGRNALFFEDGWLQRLCHAGGVDPATAAENLPHQLWAESWTHASRAAGTRRQQYRAHRARYLAVQSVRRAPEVFGLDAETAIPWRTAYETILHEHLHPAEAAEDPHYAPEFFTQPTLWTTWDKHFPGGRSSLPVARPADYAPTTDADTLIRDLCRRQVARTVLGQTFRLTDTLLDLFYADEQTGRDQSEFLARVFDWLESNDPSARQVRRDCDQWLAHLRLVVDACLDGAGRDWRELARQETWPQLFNPVPVIGVVGGSGAHRVATTQFRTPSLPRVIVCTDTLKEGVDLHLFCDRVLHYGVAWTSGDLEQRVGRVDRYFSQIERRLISDGVPPDVVLHVGYPHVVASLERAQVQRVIRRQRQIESLMDSPLNGARRESGEIVVGATASRETEPALAPYTRPLNEFPKQGRQLVAVSKQQARTIANHYAEWYVRLANGLKLHRWRVSPESHMPVRLATLYRESEQRDLEWTFDKALGRYVLTLSNLTWKGENGFHGGRRRRLVGRRWNIESFVRFLVPTQDEKLDDDAINNLINALDGRVPRVDVNASSNWEASLQAVAHGNVDWTSVHEARAILSRGGRTQKIKLSARQGFLSVISVIAPLDELEDRSEWGGEPLAENVQNWALDRTNELALGYLDVLDSEHLAFVIHVLHGSLSENTRHRLLNEVAWRADAWKTALTGADRR